MEGDRLLKKDVMANGLRHVSPVSCTRSAVSSDGQLRCRLHCMLIRPSTSWQWLVWRQSINHWRHDALPAAHVRWPLVGSVPHLFHCVIARSELGSSARKVVTTTSADASCHRTRTAWCDTAVHWL